MSLAVSSDAPITPVRLRTAVTTLESEPVTRETQANFTDEDNAAIDVINVHPEFEYQVISGFGGVLTEATAHTLLQMTPEQQDQILRQYFGPDGARYKLVRVHIDSCDFSLGTYEAMPTDDESFASFSLERDEQQIIPLLHWANEIAGGDLEVMLSPWSPPAYMKTNDSRLHGGELRPEYREMWAKYIVRYVREYRDRGFNVNRITVQNEPAASQTWDSCLFSAEQEKVFARDFLYPVLAEAGLADAVGIHVWDHNKERLFERVSGSVDESSAHAIAGVGFHWYTGDHFEQLELVHERFPNLDLVFTEGCVEYSRFGTDQLTNAEFYGHDIIGNLRAGMNASFDWNLVLDKQGGPNHASNFCDAPVMCDPAAGTIDTKLSFHYLRHISRAIAPGARRVATSTFDSRLDAVAVRNPDGTVSLVVMNPTDDSFDATIRLAEHNAPLSLAARSMTSTVIELA